jgi:hypothetical protein
VDGDISSLDVLHDHLLSLICPSKTHMVNFHFMPGHHFTYF